MYELPEPVPKHLDERLKAAHAVGRASRDAEVEGLRAERNEYKGRMQRLMTTGLELRKEIEALRADAEKWKEIAMQLGQRVNFAITHLDGKGSAMMNIETGTLTGWREYLAEGMEMIPGVTIDKEMLSVLSLPKSKQKAAREKIKAARKEKQDD